MATESLDLSKKADQPFKYKNITLIFNGMIYNYIENKKLFINSLKKELSKFKTKRGIPFDLSLLEIHLLEK